MIGFWFLEVSSLLFVYMLLNFFCSGHMFPLDMLPRFWRRAAAGGPAAIPGLFPRGRVPGQDQRAGAGLGAGDRAGVGRVLPARPARDRVSLRRAPLQRATEDERPADCSPAPAPTSACWPPSPATASSAT